MNAGVAPSVSRQPIRESLRIAGEKVSRNRVVEVRHPYSGELVATVPKAGVDDVKRALRIAREFKSTLARHERSKPSIPRQPSLPAPCPKPEHPAPPPW